MKVKIKEIVDSSPDRAIITLWGDKEKSILKAGDVFFLGSQYGWGVCISKLTRIGKEAFNQTEYAIHRDSGSFNVADAIKNAYETQEGFIVNN